MQCNFCLVFYPKDTFIQHVKTCTQESHASRVFICHLPMTIKITGTQMVEDTDGATYTEYIILINFNEV